MQCRHCQAEVVETAKFCHQCGKRITQEAGLWVKQKAKVVTGTMTGLVAGGGALPADGKADVGQTINTVEGVVTGIVLGGEGEAVHIGGEQQYINRQTVIDQREQTVHGTQTNIEGGVQTSGGIFHSGVMNRESAPQVMVAAELRNLLATVRQAGKAGALDEERLIDVEGSLRKALIQAEKVTPDREVILGHLQQAQTVVAEVAAARELADAIGAVWRLVEGQG